MADILSKLDTGLAIWLCTDFSWLPLKVLQQRNANCPTADRMWFISNLMIADFSNGPLLKKKRPDESWFPAWHYYIVSAAMSRFNWLNPGVSVSDALQDRWAKWCEGVTYTGMMRSDTIVLRYAEASCLNHLGLWEPGVFILLVLRLLPSIQWYACSGLRMFTWRSSRSLSSVSLRRPLTGLIAASSPQLSTIWQCRVVRPVPNHRQRVRAKQP